MKTINYLLCEDYKHLDLEALYAGSKTAYDILDYNLECIISTEAPITLNVLKERLRSSFDIKKISQKALDIIDERLKKVGFPVTDNLFDKVYWSLDGVFKPDYIRVGYQRQIYDVCHEEMSVLAKELMNQGYHGETLYREILKFFGYEVLTEKARTYLEYVERNTK